MLRFLLLSAALTVFAPTVVNSQTGPWVLLHIDSAVSKNVCATYAPPTSCAGVVSEQPAGLGLSYNVYLVTATWGMSSYAGVGFSIHYTNDPSAFSMLSWTLCGDLQFPGPGWGVAPASGSDIVITYDVINNCQPAGSIVVNGFFYVGAYDTAVMEVRPRGANNKLEVADCLSNEQEIPDRISSVGFSTLGCNPCVQGCFPIPVEETTWGGVKTLFRGE